MKWICGKGILQESLAKALGFTERKTTMSILGHVLILARDETLVIRATDLHTSIEVRTPCSVEKPGACSVNAKGFFDVIRELPNGEITFFTDDHDRAHLHIENQKVILNVVDPDEFPSFDLNIPSDGTRLPVEIVKRLIDQTIFSIPVSADTDTKYSLGGALLVTRQERGKQIVEMVTTDTRRLSIARHVLDEPLDMGDGIIVPRKGLQEMKRLMETREKGASIIITPTSIYYVSDTSTATVRLFQGTFPEYRNLVASDAYPIVTKIEARELLGVLKVCAVMVSDLVNCVRFSFKKGKTIVYASNPEQGEVDTVIASEHTGDDVDISFNPRYFIECLAFIEKTAVLHLKGTHGPCLVTDADKDDGRWLIMPMRY